VYFPLKASYIYSIFLDTPGSSPSNFFNYPPSLNITNSVWRIRLSVDGQNPVVVTKTN
jgi:hypothetical protein